MSVCFYVQLKQLTFQKQTYNIARYRRLNTCKENEAKEVVYQMELGQVNT